MMAIDAERVTFNSDTELDPSVRPDDPSPEQVETLYGVLEYQEQLISLAKRERKKMKAELARVSSELEKARAIPVVSGEDEWSTCVCVMNDLAELQEKYANKVDELERVSGELEEMKNRHTLLGACTTCPALRVELSQRDETIRALEKQRVRRVFLTVSPALAC